MNSGYMECKYIGFKIKIDKKNIPLLIFYSFLIKVIKMFITPVNSVAELLVTI